MAFERIKNAYGLISNPERYSPQDDVDLSEHADPSDWRDTASPSWGDRIRSRKQIALSLGLALVILVGLIAGWSRTYFPSFYEDPVVREGTKALILVSGTFYVSVKKLRGKLEQLDWLILLIPSEGIRNGLQLYVGNKDTDKDGNLVFEPVAGFSLLGLRGHPVTLGDLPDHLARQFAKRNRDPDDQATIRVEDGLHASDDTFLGTIIGVLTGGLEYDEYAADADLYTAYPDLADKETYRRLTDTLEQVTDHNSELQKRVEAHREQADYWEDKAQDRREEIIREFIRNHGELAESGFGPRRDRHDQRTERPTTPTPSLDGNGDSQ